MEEIKILQGEEEFKRLKEAQEKSIEVQRYLVYQQKLNHAYVIQKKETDTHVYISQCEYKPMFNKKMILIRKPMSGITYDKVKKTVKIWFGKKPKDTGVCISHLLSHFNIEWYNTLYAGAFYETLTQSLLQRMIRGVITNPRDYAKAILKGHKNLRETGLSAESLFKYLCSSANVSVQPFLFYCPAFKNPNQLVDLITKGRLNWRVADMVKQARILDKKIDLNWSEKRLDAEHAEWTRLIMQYEIDSVEEIDFDYPDLDMPEGLEFIKTNREVFEEGTIMKHCLYTNYAYTIRNKTYFAFRYEKDGVRATLGVDVNTKGPRFSQMFSYRNSEIDEEIKDEMKAWLEEDHVIEWFKNISSKLGVKQEEEALDMLW